MGGKEVAGVLVEEVDEAEGAGARDETARGVDIPPAGVGVEL